MPLSQKWTVQEVWNAATQDFRSAVTLHANEYLSLVNRAVLSVVSPLYGILGKSYMTQVAVTPTNDAASLAAVPVMRGFEFMSELELSKTSSTYSDTKSKATLVVGDNVVSFSSPLTSDTWVFAGAPFCYDGGGASVAFLVTNRTRFGFTVNVATDSSFEYKVAVRGTYNKVYPVFGSGTHAVNFGTVLPSWIFAGTPLCYDSNGDAVAFSISGRHSTGFSLTTDAACAFEYEVIASTRVTLISGENAVTFSPALASATWVFAGVPFAYNSSGDELAFDITARATTGFTITVSEAGFLEYAAAIQGQTTIARRGGDRIYPKGLTEFLAWGRIRDISQNRNSVVFAMDGDQLLFDRGRNIVAYPSMVLHYPRVPTAATALADYVDVPDGGATELLIMALKSSVAKRYGIQVQDVKREAAATVQGLYQASGQSIKFEEAEKKVTQFL